MTGVRAVKGTQGKEMKGLTKIHKDYRDAGITEFEFNIAARSARIKDLKRDLIRLRELAQDDDKEIRDPAKELIEEWELKIAEYEQDIAELIGEMQARRN
jgi:hypothetical protein